MTSKQRQIVVKNWMRKLLKEPYSTDIIPIIISFATNVYDLVKLNENQKCQKMLEKMGDNIPQKERIILSMNVIKINKRGKEQNRLLLLTDKALYNLKPKCLHKWQRRIDLEKLEGITISTDKQCKELVVHIHEEYDYRYKLNLDSVDINKELIISLISEQYETVTNKKLNIIKTDDKKLLKYVTNQHDKGGPAQLILLTRAQRWKRYQELIGKHQFEDEINYAQYARVTGTLIVNKETVQPKDFECLKMVAKTSSGKVIKVRKKDTDKIFFMKILKKKALIAKHSVEYSCGHHSRKLLLSMQHPFLMKLRYAFQTETKLYFVLDGYAGGELFFHLKKKRRFTEYEAKIFVAKIAMVLGHLHSLDIIHRAVKLENILLDNDGEIVLVNYGDIYFYSYAYQNNTFTGTPEYLAPEIVMNLGRGKAVDWWALGILLYELTVGIAPFYSQNVNEMYRKILEAPLLFPPNLSNDCRDLITKLLERDPKQRLGSGNNDVKDIEKHVFFNDVDWNKLYNKEIDIPYKPRDINQI